MDDWQNDLHHIKDRGLRLLETEKFSDCRFLVGQSSNQRIIAGHKLILAMASPVFERMFYGNLPDKTDPIVIPDVQPDAFYALLEYIYSDNINITSFDKACELCYVANKYMLPNVVERCTHYLWSDLSPKNACRAYEFAKLFDESRLMQSSMALIAANAREVLEDPSFLDIEVSTLMAILDQDKLNIDSELDLFNAIYRYAMERGVLKEDTPPMPQMQNDVQHAQGSSAQEAPLNLVDHNNIEEIKMEPDVIAMIHNQIDEDANLDAAQPHAAADLVDDVVLVDSDASGAETEDPEPSNFSMIYSQRMRMDEDMLQQAVRKIRFLTMTPRQFAEGPARSKLLKQDVALAILIKISSPTMNDCPMPEGFCSSRCHRNYYEPRHQRDMSSYRNSVPNDCAISNKVGGTGGGGGGGNSGAFQLPARAHSSGLVSNFSSVQLPFNNLDNGSGESELTTNDTRKSYCVRTINQQFDYRNTSVTDCGVTFQVDTNIWITGVQVPTQVLCGELMNSAGFSDRYMEILYAHIQDMQGSRLTYTHCTSRVRYDSLLEISFDRPVYIYRNQTYKVFVVFNKVGWYPMYMCLPDVVSNRVKFMFNVGNPSESVRDGLIRAIVFLTPQDSRNLTECV